MTRRFVILLAIFSSVYACGSLENYKKLDLQSKNPMNLEENYTPGQPVDISKLPYDYRFAEWKMKKIKAPVVSKIDCVHQDIENEKDELDQQSHGTLLNSRVKSQDDLDQKNHGQPLIVFIAEQSIAQRNAKIDQEKRDGLLGWRHHRRKKK